MTRSRALVVRLLDNEPYVPKRHYEQLSDELEAAERAIARERRERTRIEELLAVERQIWAVETGKARN